MVFEEKAIFAPDIVRRRQEKKESGETLRKKQLSVKLDWINDEIKRILPTKNISKGNLSQEQINELTMLFSDIQNLQCNYSDIIDKNLALSFKIQKLRRKLGNIIVN